MVIRYKKTTQRQKHLIMAIVLSTAVIIILVGGVFTSLFLSSYVIEKSLEDPDVLLHLNIVGDDIVVEIYGGRRVNELVLLSMHIEGQESHVVIDVPHGARDVVYYQAASGLTGSRMVEMRGIFSNGEDKLLSLITLKFT